MPQLIKSSTTHVVLTQRDHGDPYDVWSQHRTEAAAIQRVRQMGRHCAMGHTVCVPVSDLPRYGVDTGLCYRPDEAIAKCNSQ